MHNRRNGSCYTQKWWQHSHCLFVRMRISRASTIVNFECRVIYIPIGCRHPLMRYRQPLGENPTATCSLPHPENEGHKSVINCWSCIFCIQGIARILKLITELLTSLIGKNTLYQRKNTEFKIIDIANCKTSKYKLLAIWYAILIRYDYQTTTTGCLYQSIDGPTGRATDNPANSDGLGDFHASVPEFMVRVQWQPWPPMWQRFSLDPDASPKWRSGTVANTTPVTQAE